MSLASKLEAAIKKYESGWNYTGEGGSKQTSCSELVRNCYAEAGIIPQSSNNSSMIWAAQRNHKGLDECPNLVRIDASKTTPQHLDCLWYDGFHTSFAFKDGVFEACPLKHGVASNGKTAVGYFPYFHNCSGGKLTWIYRLRELMMTRQEIINEAMQIAEDIAFDDSHGYNNEIDHNLGRPDYDCGTFGSKCYERLLKGKIYEPNQPHGDYGYDDILTAAGFIKMPFEYSKAQRGDVLIKDGHHTELCYSKGKSIGAHNDYDRGKTGDTYGNEISVVNMAQNYWDYMYRLVDESSGKAILSVVLQQGMTGGYVETLQELLNKKIGAGLEIDGSFGPLTLAAVKKYQGEYDLEIDGIVGPKTWASLLTEEEEKPLVELNAIEKLEIAIKIFKNEYGNDPERHRALTISYGEKVADQIQDLVDLAEKK